MSDTTPPEVHAVRLRQGYLEIELDEEPDLATLQTAIAVTSLPPATTTTSASGGMSSVAAGASAEVPLVWALLQDGFTVRADLPLAAEDLELFERPDPRKIPASSVGNVLGFQGHPRDPETGLVYIRNR